VPEAASTVVLQTLDNAVTIPSEAVNDGQDGRYVYLVKPDKSVAAVKVKVAHEDGGISVISEGLKGGDQVVVDGQLRLAPGMKVAIKSTKTAASPQAAPEDQAEAQAQQAGD